MKNLPFKTSVLILSATISLNSCISTTMIHSVPEGASLYINEEPVGATPYKYSDTKIIGSSNEIRLEKEGYKTYFTQLTRLEEADPGPIIGAFFFLPAVLWAAKYKASHTYYMIPLEGDRARPLDENDNPKIKELQIMLDNGMINKEEFETEKSKILEEDKNR